MINVLITIFAVVCVAFLWIAIYDSNRFVAVHYDVSDSRIKKDFRAVVLADLHNKCYGRDNERLLGAIRAKKPDMILVAGDMLTSKPGKRFEVAVQVLRELAADYPIYYANGNHEHRIKLYPKDYGDMAKRYEDALRELGIERLVNAKVRLEELGVSMYGVEIDRFYYKRFVVQHMEPEYMAELLGAPDEDAYNILLAHNPDYFPQYAAWGADLVLSGHVHGGVARVPFWGKGMVSPRVCFFPHYDGGRFEEQNSVMLLSRGLGMHTIPFRLFNPGELVVVDFHSGKSLS